MTNGDRIRQMSDEELAQLLIGFSDIDSCPYPSDKKPDCEYWGGCGECMMNWLKQQVKDGNQV